MINKPGVENPLRVENLSMEPSKYIYVGLHGRRDHPPWCFRKGNKLHPETLYNGWINKKSPGSFKRKLKTFCLEKICYDLFCNGYFQIITNNFWDIINLHICVVDHRIKTQ